MHAGAGEMGGQEEGGELSCCRGGGDYENQIPVKNGTCFTYYIVLYIVKACPSFADMRDACVLICCFFHLAGKISTHGIFQHADMSA